MTDDKIDSRIEQICSDIAYEIATGEYLPGSKLPSVRDSARRWQVDHRLVLKAYKRLERMELVTSVPRSGYFVSVGSSHEVVSKHRFELRALFDRMSEEISGSTKLSVLGTFRYLANLAEIQARANPECVFVECTSIQAAGHADEVAKTLSIPCMPMTIDQIGGKLDRIPNQVKTVLITAFHFAEFKKWRSSGRFNLLSVPIEISPELQQRKNEQIIVFESEGTQASHMGAELQKFWPKAKIKTEVVSDIDSALADLFGGKTKRSKTRAYLSPRLWGQVGENWRNHEFVDLTRFRIAEVAWPSIADAIGLPLGTLANFQNKKT